MIRFEERISIKDLRQSFKALNKRAPAGIDKLSYRDFHANLDNQLSKLHQDIVTGDYLASDLTHFRMPKSSGIGHRDIYQTTVRDKVIQRAAGLLIWQKLEPLLSSRSYGYREGSFGDLRKAVRNLKNELCFNRTQEIVLLDITDFFNNVDQTALLGFIKELFPSDQWLWKLVESWLVPLKSAPGKAVGLAQGIPIAPVLAQLYLYRVFDNWFERHDQSYKMNYIRAVDDICLIFYKISPKRRLGILQGLQAHFSDYSLALNMEKTKKVKLDSKENSLTFSFLGTQFPLKRNQTKLPRRCSSFYFGLDIPAKKIDEISDRLRKSLGFNQSRKYGPLFAIRDFRSIIKSYYSTYDSKRARRRLNKLIANEITLFFDQFNWALIQFTFTGYNMEEMAALEDPDCEDMRNLHFIHILLKFRMGHILRQVYPQEYPYWKASFNKLVTKGGDIRNIKGRNRKNKSQRYKMITAPSLKWCSSQTPLLMESTIGIYKSSIGEDLLSSMTPEHEQALKGWQSNLLAYWPPNDFSSLNAISPARER